MGSPHKNPHKKSCSRILGVDFFLVYLHTPTIISVNFQLVENFFPQKLFIDRTINVITNAFKLQIKTFFNQTSLQKPIKSSAAYANFQSIRILGTVIYFL